MTTERAEQLAHEALMTRYHYWFRVQGPAHRAMWKAIHEGLLCNPKELPCAVCGARTGDPALRERRDGTRPKVRISYHHHDYSIPLWVTPLCAGCHSKVHWGRLPEPATGERCQYGRIHWQSPAHYRNRAA